VAVLQEHSVSVWQGKIQAKVKVGGNGPPVVFLHGVDGLRWDGFLDRLAHHHTVYAPEHPGTSLGEPEAIRHLETLWDLVLFYDEVFEALGLGAAAVVGHSFGGMVACELAANNPEHVQKLVLIAPLGLWRDDIPVTNWMLLPPNELPKFVLHRPDAEWAQQLCAVPEDPEAAALAQAQAIWALGCTGKFVWPIPDKGLKKRIHRIKAPTLILWGQDDRLVPAVYAQEFASRIGKAHAEVIREAGHCPQLEQLETVSRLVLDFLRD
jgi:pimeloyl-ACP methyl ester carboxylesterase